MKANIGVLAIAAASVLAAGCTKEAKSSQEPEPQVRLKVTKTDIRVLPPILSHLAVDLPPLPEYKYSGPAIEGSLTKPTVYKDRAMEIIAVGKANQGKITTWRADGRLIDVPDLFREAYQEWIDQSGSWSNSPDSKKELVWILFRLGSAGQPRITLNGVEPNFRSYLSGEGQLSNHLLLAFSIGKDQKSAVADVVDDFPATGPVYTISLIPGSKAGPIEVVDAEIFKTIAEPNKTQIQDLRVAFSVDDAPYPAFLEVRMKGSRGYAVAMDDPRKAVADVSLYTPGRQTHSLQVPSRVKSPLYVVFMNETNPIEAEARLIPIARIRFSGIALEPKAH